MKSVNKKIKANSKINEILDNEKTVLITQTSVYKEYLILKKTALQMMGVSIWLRFLT